MKQIKENLKGFCFTCKIRLIVPSWKYCKKCDLYSKGYEIQRIKKEVMQVEKFRIEIFNEQIKNYAVQDHLKNKNLHDKKLLVYDENNVIIGYK